MGAARAFEPVGFVGWLWRVGLLAGVLGLHGCGGDTLYDPAAPDVDPPELQITSPTAGGQVQAGQRVPIQLVGADPQGISSITIRVTGVAQSTIVLQFLPPRTTVEADTAFVVPSGASGALQIAAAAVNTKGVEGQAEAVSLSVSALDFLSPWVSLEVEAAPRMELTDEIRVTVRAFDNPGGSGIDRAALTAIVANTARTDTLVLAPVQNMAGPPADTAVAQFSFTPPFVDSLALPDTLSILFFGLAYDREGNCGGAVDSEFTNQVACDTVLVGGSERVIASAVTEPEEIIAVSGRTSPTPGGGILADILVDTLRAQVYASNYSRNRIQILSAGSGSWGREVWVGAEPWGLAMNADGDSLFVANSGGVSLSFVSLGSNPSEDLRRRFVSWNSALFEVIQEAAGISAGFIDFSDRPQFVAQDAAGRLVYSTRPTPAAEDGTVRVSWREPGWEVPENRILAFPDDLVSDEQATAIAHADSVFAAVGGECVQIWDHKPGFPDIVVTSGCQSVEEATDSMMVHVAAGNSDVWVAPRSKWSLERLALQDTTFVTASRDRKWVAFGEGGTEGEPGRINLWDSDAASIHSRLLVRDLVNNASETVTGLDLNRDGSFGMASGTGASYYWRNDLRLLGSVTKDPQGGAGAALHPDHPSHAPGLASSERTLAFVAQADHTIRILDTVHFTERGQIHIRDQVLGPLRVSPPLASDNDGRGRACTGQSCVALKLYGITDGGGVVIVDIRRRDIADLQ